MKSKHSYKIDWNELYKVNLREFTDAQTKHGIVKFLIVQRIALKYNRTKRWTRCYTEYPIENKNKKRIADVYFQNLKTGEVYCYEIQSRVTPEWQKELLKFYEKLELPFVRTNDVVIVELNELSDDIEELKDQIDKLIL